MTRREALIRNSVTQSFNLVFALLILLGCLKNLCPVFKKINVLKRQQFDWSVQARHVYASPVYAPLKVDIGR